MSPSATGRRRRCQNSTALFFGVKLDAGRGSLPTTCPPGCAGPCRRHFGGIPAFTPSNGRQRFCQNSTVSIDVNLDVDRGSPPTTCSLGNCDSCREHFGESPPSPASCRRQRHLISECQFFRVRVKLQLSFRRLSRTRSSSRYREFLHRKFCKQPSNG